MSGPSWNYTLVFEGEDTIWSGEFWSREAAEADAILAYSGEPFWLRPPEGEPFQVTPEKGGVSGG